MAQIIQFPVKKQAVSNGYENLSRLIAVAATKEVLNFYVESIEQLEKTGKLLDGEAQKLTEQGKEKRLEIAKPDPIEKRTCRGSRSISLYTRNGRPETRLPDGGIQRILRKALVH